MAYAIVMYLGPRLVAVAVVVAVVVVAVAVAVAVVAAVAVAVAALADITAFVAEVPLQWLHRQ